MKNQNDLDHDLQHIFDKYAKNLCLYALNYLETEADAEDIVQDVFIRCWEKRDILLSDEKVIKTYLFNSVRNACLDKIEKKDVMRYHIDIIKQEIIDEETITFRRKTPSGNQRRTGTNARSNPKSHYPCIHAGYEIPRSRRRSPHLDQHRQNLVTQRDQTPAFPLLSTPRTLNFLSPKSDTINRLSVLYRFIY